MLNEHQQSGGNPEAAIVPFLPRELAPHDGEAAVFSCLAIRDGGDWAVVAGSLITVGEETAAMSWPQWAAFQPATRGPGGLRQEPDLGPSFNEEPFAGIRIVRAIVAMGDWLSWAEQIEAGYLISPVGRFRFAVEDWSATKLFGQSGTGDAHQVLTSIARPVQGVAGKTEVPKLPPSQPHWVRGGSPKPLEQQTREELKGRDMFTHWPERLLGVGWLGSEEHSPPHAFVVGRAQDGIWIADVVPDHENNQLRIALGWEADRVDPFSCSVLVRTERDGAAIATRAWKISDLPGELAVDAQGREARDLPWNTRTIDLRLPRGARRTEWGMSLLGPDGWLLDDFPVATRVEQLSFTMRVAGEAGPGMETVVGDRRPPPSEVERDQERMATQELEEQTRHAAARRRLATTDELEHYLRWRFSARLGELLIIDRYLLDGGEEAVKRVIAFLGALKRDIRALVTKTDESAAAVLAAAPQISVRKVPKTSFHDRLWIVGETGVSVGASVNQFVREGAAIPATTAVDLPFADAAAWRAKFEQWWRVAASI